MTPQDHSGCIPPRSIQDPLRSSHLEPPGLPIARMDHFYGIFCAISDPPWGQFWWVQMVPSDHSGCIPPSSNQYPLRSIHLEPPEPPKARNALFMAFLNPPWRTLEPISVGPNGTDRPSWMYPTKIQPRSTEIQPFGATRATYGQKCLFMAF